MKNILNLSQAFFVGVLLLLGISQTACNDNFLEIVPDDVVPFDEFWNSPEHVKEGVNSAYEALSSGAFMGGQAWLLSELMAENLDGNRVTLNGDWAAHYTRTTDIFLGTTRSFMHDGGKVSARANFVIDNIDQIQGLAESDKIRYLAECKFLRAVAHFELVRIFAQPYGFSSDNSHLGIPIRTRYGKDIINRNTVNEVYQQVLVDLNEAANELPDENGAYATSWAAKGYLAKVYFQMNDFASAYTVANDVLENGPFEFDSLLTRRISALGTPEAVFQLVSNPIDNSAAAYYGNYRRNPNQQNTAAVTLSQGLFGEATLNPNDKRGQLWYEVDGDFIYSLKHQDTTFQQLPLVHLTELKLIRAESAGESNSNLDKGIQDLSDIRERAGLLRLPDGTTAEELISISRQERRKELATEGNRLHELKRQAVKDSPNLLIRGSIWSCPGMVSQIPDNELQGNIDMEPNPSGGC